MTQADCLLVALGKLLDVHTVMLDSVKLSRNVADTEVTTKTKHQAAIVAGWLTVCEVGEILGEDAAVPVLLQGGQLHAHDLLLLGRQLLQHILLQPPQQMWRQQLMQLGNLHIPSMGFKCMAIASNTHEGTLCGILSSAYCLALLPNMSTMPGPACNKVWPQQGASSEEVYLVFDATLKARVKTSWSHGDTFCQLLCV